MSSSRFLRPEKVCRIFKSNFIRPNFYYRLPKSFPIVYKNSRFFASQDVPVPNLGDSITEGTIVNIYKKMGDQVKTDEVIMEIETDKVTVDIRAPKDGYIEKIYKDKKSDVQVGTPLFSISDSAVAGGSSQSQPSSKPSSPKPASPKPASPKPASPQEKQQSIKSSPSPKPSPSQPQQQQQQISSHTPSSPTQHRNPMIHFRHGKREEIDKILHGISSPLQSKSQNVSKKESIPFNQLPSYLKRKPLNDAEIEAINTGGASLWDIKKPSKSDKSSKSQKPTKKK